MTVFLTAIALMGGSVSIAVAGVLLSRKIIHHNVQEGHNDVLAEGHTDLGVVCASVEGVNERSL